METLKEKITNPINKVNTTTDNWVLKKVKETLRCENFQLMDELVIRFVFHREKTDHKVFTKGGKLIYYGNWEPIDTSFRNANILIENREIKTIDYSLPGAL